jgi:hypothetical protein
VIKRTIVILSYAAPDQNRKVYTIHRGTGESARSITLAIGEQVGSITVPYSETVDYQKLANLYATKEYPTWEKL